MKVRAQCKMSHEYLRGNRKQMSDSFSKDLMTEVGLEI